MKNVRTFLEIAKATRSTWLTADEIGDEADIGYHAAKNWIEEMTAQGLLKQRDRPKPPHQPGPPAREFKLSSQWGGL